MKQSPRSLTSGVCLLAMIFVVSSCGVSSTQPTFNKNGSPATSGSRPSGACAQLQLPDLGGKKLVWLASYCKEINSFKVDPSTKSDKGEELGARNVSRGYISFKITGMLNSMITDRETFGIIFMANGNGNGEANWQWMSYRIGSPNIQSRLVIQRFDGVCPNFCEHSDITDELQFSSPQEVFKFDCLWDGQRGSVTCDITKIGDKVFKAHTENQTMGVYNSLRYIGIGSGAFNGPYPSYEGTLTDVVVAIFE